VFAFNVAVMFALKVAVVLVFEVAVVFALEVAVVLAFNVAVIIGIKMVKRVSYFRQNLNYYWSCFNLALMIVIELFNLN